MTTAGRPGKSETARLPAAPHRAGPAAAPHTGLDDASLAAFARQFSGSRKALAAALGMSERTLYRRLKQAGLA
jgi:transcriptional regulator of acetoin/glycerol metabolism